MDRLDTVTYAPYQNGISLQWQSQWIANVNHQPKPYLTIGGSEQHSNRRAMSKWDNHKTEKNR